MRRIILMFAAAILMTACAQGGGENQTDETNKNGNDQQEMSNDEGRSSDESEMGNEASTETTDKMMQGQEVAISVEAVGETMTTMKYRPERLEVPAGSVVTLTLKNTAKSEAMIHNVVVIKPGKQTEVTEAGMKAGSSADYVPENDNIIAATSLAQPGKTVEVTFNAPEKSGTYQFICTYPGHTAMKGVFLVK